MVVAVIVGALAPPAHAQVSRPASPSIRLVAAPAFVSVGSDAEFSIVTTNADGSEIITIEVHPPIDDREELAAVIGGADLGDVLGRRTARLDELGDKSTTVIGIGTQGLDGTDNDKVFLERSAVHPVRITIGPPGEAPADEIVTYLVAVDDDRPDPLPVALVMPIHAPPLRLPDETRDEEVLDQWHRGGRLERIASEIADHPEIPLTLSIGAETVESWAEVADDDAGVKEGFDALADATRSENRQVLATPYVRLHLPSLEEADLSEEVAVQHRAGASALDTALGLRVDTRTAQLSAADEASLTTLREDVFVDRVVIPEAAVSDASPRGARGGIHHVVTGDSEIEAALADPFLALMPAFGGTPAEQAQRFVAALSVDALTTPIEERSAGAVVAPPDEWRPDEGLVNEILAALDRHPLIDPVTLDQWFVRVGAAMTSDPSEVTVSPLELAAPSVSPEQLATSRFELGSLESLLGDDPRVERGRAAILRAPSADFQGASGAARVREDLGRISEDAEAFLAGITAEEKSVTLTGRSATIPLTLNNATDRTVSVNVVLDAPKLIFPDGDRIPVELPTGATTIRIPVRARASGTFPMLVTLMTSDEVFQIGPTSQITIRSTLFASIGGWISAGAIAFLALWWGLHVLRARRRAS